MQFRPSPPPEVRDVRPAQRSSPSDRDCPLDTARDRCLWHVGGTSWKRQFGFVNSDFFKTHAATQAQFAELSRNLTKNIDFGVSDPVARIAQQFAYRHLDRADLPPPTPTGRARPVDPR
jgi:hypothetical protein